ncbi:DUF262 domain-containing protein [Pseudarthrobacter sp. C1]|uniref:DUF262 domain-containing protein n=1 Tax=Pseudarthrobacter sp. C1 TaxID=3108940 RepID=UPI002B061836|nr:DUF262 domain-containing protein [Pseudarthrobacter sp. C1]MEA3549233.1 DUF262 domain-containing protein [Pseudarthrobacter sp. C1]
MRADAVTPRALFDSKVQYEIPAFQRPYVWTEEDQWSPLWADVRRVAESYLDAMPDEDELEKVSPHFLGAVVIKEISNVAGDLARSSVIDGQQRMTTLQLLLDAAQLVVEEMGDADDAEALQELVVNDSKRFRGTNRRFKLWPSRADREAFAAAMDASCHDWEAGHRIQQAHAFFQEEIREWSRNDERTENATERLSALTAVLSDRLFVVAINLSVLDDDQLIFETLNDRGTPLLAADLVKNWMFQQGETLGADVDLWAEKYWLEFDEEWWREQINQGRLLRSRIDIFLQYWLTMRTQEEVPTELVFKRFREHAKSRMLEADAATQFVQALRRDADTFRSFAEIGDQTAEGRFYRRVIEALELGATTPLLLWFVSDNHNVPRDQVETALASLESWVVRRTLLRRTTKDVNKMMVTLLKELDTAATQNSGASVRDFLADQSADSREWPTDRQMLAELPSVRLYGNVRQSRLRVILAAVESKLRDRRLEDVSLPDRLEVEHIMPRGWRTHWRASLRLEPGAEQERDQLIHTLGNLTLTTQPLNSALSNRPWTDEEARNVAPTGVDAGRGKRSMLNKFSILAINKAIVDEHPDEWSENDICARSAEITSLICQVWPRA